MPAPDWLATPTETNSPAGLPWSPRVVPERYLTDELPGIGGRIKVRPEDFLVEEIPLYDPSGQGEHIYLMVQKAGMSTLQMLGLLAKHFRVPMGALGYAGLKDKHAITRQVVSIHTPGKTAADFPAINHPRLAVLWADQHENKLRRGHLRGNHFSIRVRDVEPTRVLAAKRVLDRLTVLGSPNRLGEQRFGRCLNNHLIGRAILLADGPAALRELLLPAADTQPEHARQRELIQEGKFREAAELLPDGAATERDALLELARGSTPLDVIRRMAPVARSFFISAFQSAVFNAVLDQRLAGGAAAMGRLEPGDLAFKHDNGASFEVDPATAADPETLARLERLEISPSGPMWGLKMKRATGAPDTRELEALRAAGVELADLSACSRALDHEIHGERRPLRVPVRHAECEGGTDEFGPYVKCRFELPPGAFATVAMREIMKPERQAGATLASTAHAMGEATDER
jgi:tRNA pseudouridine13 synthase